MSVAKQIGSAVRASRRDLRLSQAELADLCGFNRHYLGQLERGLDTEYVQRVETVLDTLGLELIVRPRTDRLAAEPSDPPVEARTSDG